jgi:hypothetical protein
MKHSSEILVEKPQGKTQFGRVRHRLKNNIKMELKKPGG